MQRYFLPELKSKEITGLDAHHIMKVMRMTSGEKIIVCSDRRCFLATLEISNGRVFYELSDELKEEKDPEIRTTQTSQNRICC